MVLRLLLLLPVVATVFAAAFTDAVEKPNPPLQLLTKCLYLLLLSVLLLLLFLLLLLPVGAVRAAVCLLALLFLFCVLLLLLCAVAFCLLFVLLLLPLFGPLTVEKPPLPL